MNKFLTKETWHEAANIYPLMEGGEFDALVADIKAHGLKNPIVLFRNKETGIEKLLDGRNRILACEKAGIRPTFEIRTLKNESPVEWVISQNSIRRHLTKSQLAFVALAAEKLLAADAGKRQATSTGGNRPQLVAKLPQADSGKSRDKAAELVGVSPRYVSDAKAIQDKDPKVGRQVKKGKMSISEAKKKVLPTPKKTCTLTNKNIGDTRCLSMAKERLWYTEGKVELLLAALKDPGFEEERKTILKTLKIYQQAFKDFMSFLEKGLQRIETGLDK